MTSQFRLDIRKSGLYSKGGEALEQVAWKRCGSPILGEVQGQVGWGSIQPDLEGGSPAHDRRLEVDDL